MGFINQCKQWFDNTPQQTQTIDIYSPVSGEIVSIEQVPDIVFAEKIVGDGLAITPHGSTIHAPVDGTIGKIFETNHAFSIVTKEGVELFIHFGVGTVELQGTGFSRLVEQGAEVHIGDPILQFDLNFIQEQVTSTVTPVVIANMDAIQGLSKKKGSVTAKQDILFSVTI
ncbi:PTS glucose transporter subunit IIA [Parashewanella curva]|uniref:PTS system glucose-specific EIIA component n=1 Tax=Parashewanella curva TaxID=2338552 RepID=A0A3L8PV19_9GAMM|nr:PTS glucose transporter subunit IIA [Parashewanella curva]RLV59267.1 PTS glucose transporter subunit IIA [Parashewanella curva]